MVAETPQVGDFIQVIRGPHRGLNGAVTDVRRFKCTVMLDTPAPKKIVRLSHCDVRSQQSPVETLLIHDGDDDNKKQNPSLLPKRSYNNRSDFFSRNQRRSERFTRHLNAQRGTTQRNNNNVDCDRVIYPPSIRKTEKLWSVIPEHDETSTDHTSMISKSVKSIDAPGSLSGRKLIDSLFGEENEAEQREDAGVVMEKVDEDEREEEEICFDQNENNRPLSSGTLIGEALWSTNHTSDARKRSQHQTSDGYLRSLHHQANGSKQRPPNSGTLARGALWSRNQANDDLIRSVRGEPSVYHVNDYSKQAPPPSGDLSEKGLWSKSQRKDDHVMRSIHQTDEDYLGSEHHIKNDSTQHPSRALIAEALRSINQTNDDFLRSASAESTDDDYLDSVNPLFENNIRPVHQADADYIHKVVPNGDQKDRLFHNRKQYIQSDPSPRKESDDPDNAMSSNRKTQRRTLNKKETSVKTKSAGWSAFTATGNENLPGSNIQQLASSPRPLPHLIPHQEESFNEDTRIYSSCKPPKPSLLKNTAIKKQSSLFSSSIRKHASALVNSSQSWAKKFAACSTSLEQVDAGSLLGAKNAKNHTSSIYRKTEKATKLNDIFFEMEPGLCPVEEAWKKNMTQFENNTLSTFAKSSGDCPLLEFEIEDFATTAVTAETSSSTFKVSSCNVFENSLGYLKQLVTTAAATTTAKPCSRKPTKPKKPEREEKYYLPKVKNKYSRRCNRVDPPASNNPTELFQDPPTIQFDSIWSLEKALSVLSTGNDQPSKTTNSIADTKGSTTLEGSLDEESVIIDYEVEEEEAEEEEVQLPPAISDLSKNFLEAVDSLVTNDVSNDFVAIAEDSFAQQILDTVDTCSTMEEVGSSILEMEPITPVSPVLTLEPAISQEQNLEAVDPDTGHGSPVVNMEADNNVSSLPALRIITNDDVGENIGVATNADGMITINSESALACSESAGQNKEYLGTVDDDLLSPITLPSAVESTNDLDDEVKPEKKDNVALVSPKRVTFQEPSLSHPPTAKRVDETLKLAESPKVELPKVELERTSSPPRPPTPERKLQKSAVASKHDLQMPALTATGQRGDRALAESMMLSTSSSWRTSNTSSTCSSTSSSSTPTPSPEKWLKTIQVNPSDLSTMVIYEELVDLNQMIEQSRQTRMSQACDPASELSTMVLYESSSDEQSAGADDLIVHA